MVQNVPQRPDDEDIDAKFAGIVADFERSSAPAERHDLDTPVDESLHLEGGSLSVALVLTPIPSAEALHKLLQLAGLSVHVVPIKPWTAIWLKVDSNQPMTEEDELASLMGKCRSMPPEVDQVARLTSRLSKLGSVAIMSWLVEGDEEDVESGVSGQISARRYVSGEPEDDIPAGVLIGSMPVALEDLLLGRTTPDDYNGSVAPDGTCLKRPRGPLGWFRKP